MPHNGFHTLAYGLRVILRVVLNFVEKILRCAQNDIFLMVLRFVGLLFWRMYVRHGRRDVDITPYGFLWGCFFGFVCGMWVFGQSYHWTCI